MNRLKPATLSIPFWEVPSVWVLISAEGSFRTCITHILKGRLPQRSRYFLASILE